MKKFAIIGVAGYIAPRHLSAIKETKNELVAAMDINDSVGILDSYFPNSEFFTKFEDFAAFIEDIKIKNDKIDYISICSPNYLHLPHIKFALKNGIDVICEKPLVLNSSEIEMLRVYEKKFKAKVNTILQLRLHPSIIELKNKVLSSTKDKVFDVELTYLTSRGNWYLESWKGVDYKSGGVATNIGVHFYDMLGFIFGEVKENKVHYHDKKTASGFLRYENANVKWFLSIDPNNLPENAIKGEKLTYRNIKIGNEELEFSSGFTDLHTESYKNILDEKGFGLDDNLSAIKTVETIRIKNISNPGNQGHPLLAKVKNNA